METRKTVGDSELRSTPRDARSELGGKPIASIGVLVPIIATLVAATLIIAELVVTWWLFAIVLVLATTVAVVHWKQRNVNGPIRELPLTALYAPSSLLMAGTMSFGVWSVWRTVLTLMFAVLCFWFSYLTLKDWRGFCSWLSYNIENQGERLADKKLFGELGQKRRTR